MEPSRSDSILCSWNTTWRIAIAKPDETRTNRQIRVKEVRLIDQAGEQIGIVPTKDALERAENAGLDLVEVAPDANPPVCKIFDFKKVVYEKKKKLKESRKKTNVTHLKEIKVKMAIGEHALGIKVRRARNFLEKSDKVKFTLTFRGREITKPEQADKLIRLIKEELQDIGEVEQPPSRMGRQIHFIMSRRKDYKPKEQQQS